MRWLGPPMWSWWSSVSVRMSSWPGPLGPTSGRGGRSRWTVDMRTSLPDVFAAGDCVVTYHRLLGPTYVPLGTTAHKQGRVAGENALGGQREFAGSLGTQVVKVFEMAAARTGLRDHEARAAGFEPVTVGHEADDHKAYYPGSHRIAMRYTGDVEDGPSARTPALWAPACGGGETYRHRGHRHLPRDDRRRHKRPRPLVHATARKPLGRRSGRCSGLGAGKQCGTPTLG